jgi:hypothetical protein
MLKNEACSFLLKVDTGAVTSEPEVNKLNIKPVRNFSLSLR